VRSGEPMCPGQVLIALLVVFVGVVGVVVVAVVVVQKPLSIWNGFSKPCKPGSLHNDVWSLRMSV
jgi:hypothetical protein